MKHMYWHISQYRTTSKGKQKHRTYSANTYMQESRRKSTTAERSVNMKLNELPDSV